MVAAKRTHQVKDGEQGFTMVEMLVALVLATIVLSGTLALQVAMIQGAGETRQSTALTRLANTRLEEFRTTQYAALTATASYVWTCYDLRLQPVACLSTNITARYRCAFRITDNGTGFVAEAWVHARTEGGTWMWGPWFTLTLERGE